MPATAYITPSSRRAGARARALVVVLAALTGCATAPPEAATVLPAEADLAGSYRGVLNLDATELDATLELTQVGDTLAVRIAVPQVGAMGRGRGRVEGDHVRFRVRYGMECPGEAHFMGGLEDDGRTLSGTVRAEDCDRVVSGTFRFVREEA
jgi:hypothetical protein